MQIDVDSDGSYLVPDEFEHTLIGKRIPIVATRGTAAWVEEESALPERDVLFGMVNLGAYKLNTESVRTRVRPLYRLR
ncbi:MAG: hypothetical protein LBU32_31925 [Clostridiales bacterium]|jgi:hypothetical protein|nr:hypothetical protein [Clostridiales bacterium]